MVLGDSEAMLSVFAKRESLPLASNPTL